MRRACVRCRREAPRCARMSLPSTATHVPLALCDMSKDTLLCIVEHCGEHELGYLMRRRLLVALCRSSAVSYFDGVPLPCPSNPKVVELDLDILSTDSRTRATEPVYVFDATDALARVKVAKAKDNMLAAWQVVLEDGERRVLTIQTTQFRVQTEQSLGRIEYNDLRAAVTDDDGRVIKLPQNCSIFLAGRVLWWYHKPIKKGAMRVAISLAGLSAADVRDKYDRLSVATEEELGLSKSVIDKCSGTAMGFRAKLRRETKTPGDYRRLALQAVLNDLKRGANASVESLILLRQRVSVTEYHPIVSTTALKMSSLQSLCCVKLRQLCLEPEQIDALRGAAPRLETVDLTDCTSMCVWSSHCALGRLVNAWRKLPSATLRKLILDNFDLCKDVTNCHISALRDLVAFPNNDPIRLVLLGAMPSPAAGSLRFAMQDDHSVLLEGAGPDVYVSMIGVCTRTWRQVCTDLYPATAAFDAFNKICALQTLPVRSVPSAAAAALHARHANPRPEQVAIFYETDGKMQMQTLRPLLKHSKPGPRTANPATGASDGSPEARYKDADREQTRHQWQWFDQACKNCGQIWIKNAVTISFRQTAVSECFKGKRACSDRREFALMQRGELFLTGKHDLTPSKEETLKAEKVGCLVSRNPTTMLLEYHRLGADGLTRTRVSTPF